MVGAAIGAGSTGRCSIGGSVGEGRGPRRSMLRPGGIAAVQVRSRGGRAPVVGVLLGDRAALDLALEGGAAPRALGLGQLDEPDDRRRIGGHVQVAGDPAERQPVRPACTPLAPRPFAAYSAAGVRLASPSAPMVTTSTSSSDPRGTTVADTMLAPFGTFIPATPAAVRPMVRTSSAGKRVTSPWSWASTRSSSSRHSSTAAIRSPSLTPAAWIDRCGRRGTRRRRCA